PAVTPSAARQRPAPGLRARLLAVAVDQKISWRDFARNGGLYYGGTKNTLTKETRSPMVLMVLSNLITWLNGRRPATTPAKATRARPGVELLESREVPTVNFTLTEGVLTIQCVNQNNDAVVKTVSTKVEVVVHSNGPVRQGDTLTEPASITKE